MTDTTLEAVERLIAAITEDRDAGTPGPWKAEINPQDKQQFLISGSTWDYFAQVWSFVTGHLSAMPFAASQGAANVRRIARVPDMEDAVLALSAENARLRERGDKLAAALEDIADGMGETDLRDIGRFAPAVARAALKGDDHD